jgi:hypothetical protein
MAGIRLRKPVFGRLEFMPCLPFAPVSTLLPLKKSADFDRQAIDKGLHAHQCRLDFVNGSSITASDMAGTTGTKGSAGHHGYFFLK